MECPVKASYAFMRFQNYFQKNGALKTFLYLFEFAGRFIFRNQTLIFFVNLSDVSNEYGKLPKDIKVEWINSEDKIQEKDLIRLTSYWVKELSYKNIKERFKRGDTNLWILRYKGEIAAFMWSTCRIQNRDLFFPYTDRDIYIFDHVTFPQYRGQQFHSTLMKYVLYKLKKKGFIRSFMYVFKWNQASLSSVAKMDWKLFGTARKLHIFNKNITIWS